MVCCPTARQQARTLGSRVCFAGRSGHSLGATTGWIRSCCREKSRTAIKTGIRPRPESERTYSTRGGRSPKSRRTTRPSDSNSRKCCVSIFCEMFGMSRMNCEARIDGPANSLNKIGSFQRPSIMRRVLVTCVTDPSAPRQISLSSGFTGTLWCVIASSICCPLIPTANNIGLLQWI